MPEESKPLASAFSLHAGEPDVPAGELSPSAGESNAPAGEFKPPRYVWRAAASFSAKAPTEITYIDVENGDLIVASTNKFLPPKRYRRMTLTPRQWGLELGHAPPVIDVVMKIQRKDRAANTEVDGLSYVWRYVLKLLVLLTKDEVNALNTTRGLQIEVPMQSGYEAYLIDQVITALERGSRHYLNYVLSVCFRNRNVSRVIVQNMSRHDFLWHLQHQFRWNRWYDGWGTTSAIPVIGNILGITSFPATENFPSTTKHVIAAVVRRVLGEGTWLTRVVTGLEELVTYTDGATAQNLAAESNGFETANRNQHGSYFGRLRTNAFRLQHRLPADESVMRTFIVDPLSTMLNNGIEHVLLVVANHYRNMIFQPFGNFAHQRMEQLQPFELLRFHLPVVFVALTSIRGIAAWDSAVLAPVVAKLQKIKPVRDVTPIRELVTQCQESIVVGVCGGHPIRSHALRKLLVAVDEALELLQAEAGAVKALVDSVASGLAVGRALLHRVSFSVPCDQALKAAVFAVCLGKEPKAVTAQPVRRALSLLAPKDKRTLIELCIKDQQRSYPAELLAKRTAVLLKRELRRDALDRELHAMSQGEELVSTAFAPVQLKLHAAYWLIEPDGKKDVFVYEGKKTQRDIFSFVHRAARWSRMITPEDGIRACAYMDAAEEITRAQKAFMTIELDMCKRFKYDAFMEFKEMRPQLRQLLVLAQVHCSTLDEARLNVLSSIKHSIATTEVHPQDLEVGRTYWMYEKKQYEPYKCTKPFVRGDPESEALLRKVFFMVPPQSMIVVGGGPTGLMTTLHCLENVLASNGEMKLLESRDAFLQAGATFERSQIVRLDARWISMLRYHLGTLFEDVWIPAAGETDSHCGNTLPSQGFIEITIKDLEQVMNDGLARLVSRNLVRHDTNAGAQYSRESNSLVKLGKALKEGDKVLRKKNPDGEESTKDFTWRVKNLERMPDLAPTELELGKEYSVYLSRTRTLRRFQLVGMNLAAQTYSWKALEEGVTDIECRASAMPRVYHAGTRQHAAETKLVLECELRGMDGTFRTEVFDFEEIANELFTIDIGACHVCEAIGKPHGSTVHFSVTTSEPYGVACLSGLKVSMGMHKFGTPRWHVNLIDDIRSHTDQNTRVVGDFTKVVNVSKITETMSQIIESEKEWQLHFGKVVADVGFGDQLSDVTTRITERVRELKEGAPYRRSHLQTRFFETGDNFYLGMEFTREYDRWKKATVEGLVAVAAAATPDAAQRAAAVRLKSLSRNLDHHLDRLWYDATLETIRFGDVYNPGGHTKIPRLYLIDSLVETTLGTLGVGEAFRLVADPTDRFEVLVKHGGGSLVRNVEGFIQHMGASAKVCRGGNLTRRPDGNAESKVALSTFPVSHYVNHRTMRLSNRDKGYVFAFLGDEQSTPHFMRYSGLTGACINSMLFNNFIGDAIHGEDFTSRFREYSRETNWSNGEVVQRGTGANYGKDGFLRPGFPYKEGVRYLHSKVMEYRESEQDVDALLSRDWKIKFAAALIPQGLEHNDAFLEALMRQLLNAVLDYFIDLVGQDPQLGSAVAEAVRSSAATVSHVHFASAAKSPSRVTPMTDDGAAADSFWSELLKAVDLPPEPMRRLEEPHVFIATKLMTTFGQVVDYAKGAFRRNERASSQLETQPKSLDFYVDDFAVEAQQFANSLTNSAALAAGAVALQFESQGGSLALSIISPLVAIGTITNTSRYKSRNEDWRVKFADERYVHVLKGVYCCLSKADREAIGREHNPLCQMLEAQKMTLLANIAYYDYPEPVAFLEAYKQLVEKLHDPLAIATFKEALVQRFIPEDYAVNSYLQENLTALFATCEELLSIEESAGTTDAAFAQEARVLFERLLLLKPRLETSLQRGPILHGYSKQRSLKHSHPATLCMLFWSKLWITRTSQRSVPKTLNAVRAATRWVSKPFVSEAKEIAAQTRHLSCKLPAPLLRREAMDMESLYYAAQESYSCSFIIISGWLTFWTFFVFAIGNICALATNESWPDHILMAASGASAFNQPLTAILSVVLLWRKTAKISSCALNVFAKAARTTDTKARSVVNHVAWIAVFVAITVIIRILGSLAAAVSIPWNFARTLSCCEGSIDRDPPLYIALGAIGVHVFGLLLRFVAEYSVFWRLDPRSGEYLCDAFDKEISALKSDLDVPRSSSTVPEQVHGRALWEYVARAFVHKYRFDSVFRANRFGRIFHFLQVGRKGSLDQVVRSRRKSLLEASRPAAERQLARIKTQQHINTLFGSASRLPPATLGGDGTHVAVTRDRSGSLSSFPIDENHVEQHAATDTSSVDQSSVELHVTTRRGSPGLSRIEQHAAASTLSVEESSIVDLATIQRHPGTLSSTRTSDANVRRGRCDSSVASNVSTHEYIM